MKADEQEHYVSHIAGRHPVEGISEINLSDGGGRKYKTKVVVQSRLFFNVDFVGDNLQKLF